MKTGTLIFAFVAALLCAGTAFAEDPESYRAKLLKRPLPEEYERFCRAKTSYEDCKVTQLFLDDIDAGKTQKKPDGSDICPSGAHINYAGNDEYAKQISLRCTLKS